MEGMLPINFASRRRPRGGPLDARPPSRGRANAGRIVVVALVAAFAVVMSASAAPAGGRGDRAASSSPFERLGSGLRAAVDGLHHRVAPAAVDQHRHPYRGRVGATSQMIWYPPREQLRYLRRARRAGLSWVREDFAWGAYERRPGVWNWSVGDTFMRNLSRAGLDVLPVIAYSPGWAASGPTIYHPPRNAAAYANFCKRLAQRYGVGGTFWAQNPRLRPRPIQVMEIWNEPWHDRFWRPRPDPRAYARLVRASAQAVRSVAPEIKILASGDLWQMVGGRTPEWFEPLLRADPALFRNLVDGYSVHLYVQSRSPLDTTTPQRWRFDRALLSRELAARAGAPHPLWVTEFGWSTFRGNQDSVSERLQARYVRDALRVAHVEWGEFVERSFVFFWGKASRDYAGGYSILRPNGSGKPVFNTLSALSSP